MAFDMAYMSGLLKIVACFLAPVVLFRIWAFGLKPLLHPDEPKELPYWIPYLGHAIEFVKNGQGVITKARNYFGNTREPFALTLGGEKVYFLTSPDDVSTMYKNTSSLVFDRIVHELTMTFGVSKATVDKVFERPVSKKDDAVARALDVQNPRLKSLSELNNDFWKLQLNPGPKYQVLQTLFTKYLEKSLDAKTDGVEKTHLKTIPGTDDYLVSLLSWTQGILIDAALRAFFGDALIESEPQIVDDFLAFDDDNWKLWYKWPQADAMFAAKARVSAALKRYITLPRQKREGASFIVDTFIEGQRAIGTPDEDLANILCMVVFVTNTNTYKVCFWAIAHLMQDQALLVKIRTETDATYASDGSLSLHHLADDCPWLSALFHEALRFCSASSSIRLVTETTYIGSKRFPVGSRVMVPFRQMHFNEHVYDSPHVFDPERFILNKKLAHSTSYRPFGGGISYCPGRFIAKQEVCVFIALILKKYDIAVHGNQQMPELDTRKPTTGLMSPKDGEDMVLRLRARSGN